MAHRLSMATTKENENGVIKMMVTVFDVQLYENVRFLQILVRISIDEGLVGGSMSA